jgi:hypothetical protein
MYGKLIIEILIKFAAAAMIIMRAGPECNMTDHMVQAGLLPDRQLAQFVFPEGNPAAFALSDLTIFIELLVLRGNPSHGSVISARGALVLKLAKLFRDYPRLHPDACRAIS